MAFLGIKTECFLEVLNEMDLERANRTDGFLSNLSTRFKSVVLR